MKEQDHRLNFVHTINRTHTRWVSYQTIPQWRVINTASLAKEGKNANDQTVEKKSEVINSINERQLFTQEFLVICPLVNNQSTAHNNKILLVAPPRIEIEDNLIPF